MDIETDEARRLTVLGVGRSDGRFRQWVRPEFSRGELLEFLEGAAVLMSYNGLRFDLPVIREELGVDLARLLPHRDLWIDCRARRLRGGLKRVEERLGIHRDTSGLTGWDAIRLWRAHQRGDSEALTLLLRYNREDVENLEILARRLGIGPSVGSPVPAVWGGWE